MVQIVAATPVWQEVARASSPAELEKVTPSISHLEHGQRFNFELRLAWYAPIGPIFDLFFAEQFVSIFLDVGGRVLDVYSTGLHDVRIECIADTSQITQMAPGIQALPALAALPALIGAVARALFYIAVIIVGIIVLVRVAPQVIDIISMFVPLLLVVLMMSVMGSIMPSEPKEPKQLEQP